MSEHDFGKKLEDQTTGVSLRITSFGDKKACKGEGKNKAVDAVDADKEEVTLYRRVIAKYDKDYLKVKSVLSDAKAYHEAMSLPYPDRGVRLIAKDKVPEYDEKMKKFASALLEEAGKFNDCIEKIKEDRRKKLGKLFQENDYPDDFKMCFGLDWSFPPLSPPDDLKKIHPEIYKKELERVKNKFAESVELAESAFAKEMKKLLDSLAKKISKKSKTKSKKSKLDDDSFNKLKSFVDRFKELSIGSNEELTSLVEQASELTNGVNYDDKSTYEELANKFTEISDQADGMIVEKQVRAIQFED